MVVTVPKFVLYCRSEISALGIYQLQAIKFAIDTINNDSKLLPTVKLWLNVYDANAFEEEDTYLLQELKRHGNWDPVVGIIGPGSNSATMTLLNHPGYKLVGNLLSFTVNPHFFFVMLSLQEIHNLGVKIKPCFSPLLSLIRLDEITFSSF